MLGVWYVAVCFQNKIFEDPLRGVHRVGIQYIQYCRT
jgi:hypothetical protein